ncbi:MAG: phenylalanine--tRNA ligase subunit alpha, partial [Clostridium sp.]|nr:phenylalanine--tRNA ligase subunit alpha [Clostridium sp.]MDU2852351.1 phenylalanine--tRNA ligase subunit alpha [Clostridium sp.]
MQEKLMQIQEVALKEIEEASNSTALSDIRVKYLGKKGELTTILKSMGGLSKEERPIVGKMVNDVKKVVEEKLDAAINAIKEKEKNEKLQNEIIDITLPGKKNVLGKRHPLELTLERIKDIFISMGFSIEDGPEVELDHYNFEALNIPKNHPARSEQDTFYINDNIVLRTQT